MNKKEIEDVKRYLGANLISTVFFSPENIEYDILLVWNDLPYEDKWNHVPEDLIFTGGTITDGNLNAIKVHINKFVLHQPFIDKYLDKELSLNIALRAILPEDVIENLADKCGDTNWNTITQFQILSESFLIKHQDKIPWLIACKYQLISDKLLKKFSPQIQKMSDKHNNVSREFIRQFVSNIDWNAIANSARLT